MNNSLVIESDKIGGISIIGAILFGIIVVMVLGYFHISIRAVVESPDAQDNLHYVGGGTISLWDKYLKGPVTTFWNKVVVPIFWDAFVSAIKNIRDGKPTDLQNMAPTVNFGASQ